MDDRLTLGLIEFLKDIEHMFDIRPGRPAPADSDGGTSAVGHPLERRRSRAGVTAVPASAVGPAYVFRHRQRVRLRLLRELDRALDAGALLDRRRGEGNRASLATVFSRPAAGGGPPGALEGPTRVLTFDRRAGAIDGIEAGELVVLATARDCVIRAPGPGRGVEAAPTARPVARAATPSTIRR